MDCYTDLVILGEFNYAVIVRNTMDVSSDLISESLFRADCYSTN